MGKQKPKHKPKPKPSSLPPCKSIKISSLIPPKSPTNSPCSSAESESPAGAISDDSFICSNARILKALPPPFPLELNVPLSPVPALSTAGVGTLAHYDVGTSAPTVTDCSPSSSHGAPLNSEFPPLVDSLLPPPSRPPSARPSSASYAPHPVSNPSQHVQGRRATFSEVVVGNRAPASLTPLEFEPGYESGIIDYTEEDIAEQVSKWSLCLVGDVVGDKTTFNIMRTFVEARWNFCESRPKVLQNEDGLFIFKFANEEDLSRVLKGGPWMVGGARPLILRRWKRGIPLNLSCLDTVPVWVTLSGLNLEFWCETIFRKIGSAIGRPLYINKITATEERLFHEG